MNRFYDKHNGNYVIPTDEWASVMAEAMSFIAESDGRYALVFQSGETTGTGEAFWVVANVNNF